MTTGVAVALYNGEKFLEKQMDSLRLQTKELDQVVFCDDGSKDGTVGLVKDYIERYGLGDRWQLMINETNLGYIRNFYHAMEQCRTDLIFLCDQDDIWRLNKVEKMTQVMERDPHIALLSCRHGVIDGQDQPIRGLLAPKEADDLSLNPITIEDMMRSFRWPGMCMCIRAEAFRQILPRINEEKIPHDVALAVCAVEDGGFWEYGFVGADHRRHNNNAGNEEHRITKVLNLRRKLSEIETYNHMLDRILKGKLVSDQKLLDCVRQRLALSCARKDALMGRSLKKLRKAYRGEGSFMLRKFSLICDIWLIIFGNYREIC